MSDKKNQAAAKDEFGADFDFTSMDWSGGGDDKAKDGAAAGFGDDGFGAHDDGFGGDDGFGSDDPKDSPDDFGTSSFGDAGPFGAGDDSFGADDAFGDHQFDQMPVPGANPDSTTPGNPDDEFADIGGGGGFSDSFDPDHERDASFPAGHDAFAEAPAPAAEEDDVFGEFAPADAAAPAAAAAASAPAGTSKLGKLIFPVAALAVAGGLGYLGYTTFLTQPDVAAVATPAVDAPPTGVAPADLPPPPQGNSGDVIAANDLSGLGAPGAPSVPAIPAPAAQPVGGAKPDGGMDDLTGGDRGGLGTGAPSADADPAPSASGAPPVLPLPLPGAGGAATPDAPPASAATAPSLPDATTAAAPDALPAASVPAAADDDGPTDADIERLEDRLAALERKIEELSRAAAPAEAAVPAPPPAAGADAARLAGGAAVPPLKPIIVEGVSLKGVSRDMAWVGTPSGVVEVRAGDTVPGAGKVVRIRPYGGDWILVTEKGLVTR